MNRRQFLGSLGAAGGASLAALAVVLDDAAAETDLELNIADDHAQLDVGDAIAAVWLDLSVEWAYELPNGSSPETVVVEIAAGVDEPELVEVAEEPTLFNSADGSESFEVDLLGAGVVDGEQLLETGEQTVEIEARLFVESDGGLLAREIVSDNATVSVDVDELDVDEFGELTGSGSLNIETA